MTNIPLKTIPGAINIPGNLEEFKRAEQVVWTGNRWRTKGPFTPDYGDKNFFNHNPSYDIYSQTDMYNPSNSTGLALYCAAGAEHNGNYEMYGDGRWMPASIFNGLGFEVQQDADHKHAIYLRYYALAFAHREGNGYRFWGVDTGAREKYKGYRYISFSSSSPAVNTIRSWGEEWLFQGVILHVWNGSGAGSGTSYMYVYNMKVGSKMSTTGGQYRYLPAGKRPYGRRDPRKGNGGTLNFTNLFTE